VVCSYLIAKKKHNIKKGAVVVFSGITQSISSYGGKRGQSITLCQLWEIEKTYFHQGRNLT
jgi:hypothetical protein